MDTPFHTNEPTSTRLQQSVRTQPSSDEIIDENEVKLVNYANNLTMERSLTGVPRPVPSGAPPARNLFENSTTATLIPSSDAVFQTNDEYVSDGGILSTVLCVLILVPCIVACVAQSIFWAQRRKIARAERELHEVGTNPASRMLVLCEIFKNDSRAVTEDDAIPKKKRVLVKKHRSKTPSERAGTSWDATDINDSDESHRHDEETGTLRLNRNGTISEDQNDDPWWREEDEVIVASNDNTPLVVYIPENIENHNENTFGKTSLELDDVSAIGGEDSHEIRSINETSKDDSKSHEGRGKFTGDSLGQTFDRGTDEEKVHCKGTSNDDIIDNDIICINDSDSGEGDQMVTASLPDNIGVPEPDDKPGTSPKMKDSSLAGTPKIMLLAPRITPRLSNAKDACKLQEKSQHKIPSDTTKDLNNGPDFPFLTNGSGTLPKSCLSPRASVIETNSELSSPRMLNLPDFSNGDRDDNGMSANEIPMFQESGTDEDVQSTATEVISNVEELKEGGSGPEDIKLENLQTTSGKDTTTSSLSPPYQLETVNSGVGTMSDLGRATPLRTVESYKSTASSALSSNVSYFSYEDASIASEDLEMCAICLCPYDEGDVLIFSKRCSHSFHKECILEWLVKNHSECPCCRITMVTKSEIEETSASLIGTERLAQALAVVDVSEGMQEAPPLRIRRRQLARQMLTRARSQGRRARHMEGAGIRSVFLSSSHGARSTNNNWLWVTRFAGPTSPNPQPTVINPTRSADAIMNPHETNQHSLSVATGGGGEAHTHTTSNTSMFHDNWHNQALPTSAASPSNATVYHNHWQQQRSPSRRSINQTMTLSPVRRHGYWNQNTPNSSPDTEL